MDWKTLCGRVHYQSDAFSVLDNGLFRWLTLNSTDIHTLMYKPNPQKYGLQYIKPLTFAATYKPGSICLLGLGGGGVLHALKPQLPEEVPITVIELNQPIIDASYTFFKLGQLSSINIINADAKDYLARQSNSGSFRHLLVDIYGQHTFPTNCFSMDFFYHCQQVLSIDGYLTVNIPTKKEYDVILPWVKTLFNGRVVTFLIKKCNNHVLIASADPIKNFLDYLYSKQKIKKLVWCPDIGYWGLC